MKLIDFRRLSQALCLGLLLATATGFSASVPYTKLALMDLDEMDAMVKAKVKEAKASIEKEGIDHAIAVYQETLVAVFSRPNSDSMIEKLIEPIRSGLTELGAWEKSLQSMTDSSIKNLKDPQNIPALQQVTDLIILNNFVNEFAPEAKKIPVMTEMFFRIKDASITASKDAKSEIALKGFTGLLLPSEKAAAVVIDEGAESKDKKKPKKK